MGRRSRSPPIGSRYGRVCEELLDMGARVAVRFYSHCRQTGRMYYKPPSATPSTAADGSGNESNGASDASSSAAASRRRQQQQLAAPQVDFHASEFILYGGGGIGKEEPRHCSG